MCKCANCQSERFQIKSRSLCSRCYPLTLKKESAEKWNRDDSSTLAGCDYPATDPERFEEFKAAYVEIIDKRLDILRHREEVYNGVREPTGLEIEYQFARVAEKAGIKDGFTLTHGWVGHIDSLMSSNARSWLYTALCNIEEEMEKPWQGLGVGNVLEYIRQTKAMERTHSDE